MAGLPLSTVQRWPPRVLHRRVNGQTLAYIASKYGNLDLLRWLVEQGVDYSSGNDRNITPFSAAVKHGHLMVAQFLHSKEVDLAADVNGNSPFLYACMRGHAECARWLHQVGVDLSLTNRDDEDALVLACRFAHLQLADWLVSVHPFPAQRYLDIMHTACVLGHLSVAKWVCAVGQEYLHCANPLYHACKNGNLAVAQWLVQEGASVHVTTNGQTPFYAAATMYHMEVMVWLHSVGASITAPDPQGFTPLQRVCTMQLSYNDRFYFFYYAVWLILNGAVSNRQGYISKAALRKQVGKGRKFVLENIERLLEETARYARALMRVRGRLPDDVVGHIADYVGVLRGRKLRNARQIKYYL